jgi:hypothetical protein
VPDGRNGTLWKQAEDPERLAVLAGVTALTANLFQEMKNHAQ